jgi:serine/threonine protein kinase
MTNASTFTRTWAGKAAQSGFFSRLATELARILITAHERGVIVRDLSPANVVVAESGAVTIIDFGLGAHGLLTFFRRLDRGGLYRIPCTASPVPHQTVATGLSD